jgi:hypothetical protein
VQQQVDDEFMDMSMRTHTNDRRANVLRVCVCVCVRVRVRVCKVCERAGVCLLVRLIATLFPAFSETICRPH